MKHFCIRLYIILCCIGVSVDLTAGPNKDSLLIFVGTIQCDVINFKPSSLSKISFLKDYDIIYIYPPTIKEDFLDFSFESTFKELIADGYQVVSSAELFRQYSPDYSTCVIDTRTNTKHYSFESFYTSSIDSLDALRIELADSTRLNYPDLIVLDESSIILTSNLNTAIVKVQKNFDTYKEIKSIELYKHLPRIRAKLLEGRGLEEHVIDSTLTSDSILISSIDDPFRKKSYFKAIEATNRFPLVINDVMYTLIKITVIDSFFVKEDSDQVVLSNKLCLLKLDLASFELIDAWQIDKIADFSFHQQGWYVTDSVTLVISLIDDFERREKDTPILAEFTLDSGFASFNRLLDNNYVDGQIADPFTMSYMGMRFCTTPIGRHFFLHDVDKSIWEVGRHYKVAQLKDYESFTIDHFLGGHLPSSAYHFDYFDNRYRIAIINYDNRSNEEDTDSEFSTDVVLLHDDFSFDKTFSVNNHPGVKSVSLFENKLYQVIEEGDVFILKSFQLD